MMVGYDGRLGGIHVYRLEWETEWALTLIIRVLASLHSYPSVSCKYLCLMYSGAQGLVAVMYMLHMIINRKLCHHYLLVWLSGYSQQSVLYMHQLSDGMIPPSRNSYSKFSTQHNWGLYVSDMRCVERGAWLVHICVVL